MFISSSGHARVPISFNKYMSFQSAKCRVVSILKIFLSRIAPCQLLWCNKTICRETECFIFFCVVHISTFYYCLVCVCLSKSFLASLAVDIQCQSFFSSSLTLLLEMMMMIMMVSRGVKVCHISFGRETCCLFDDWLLLKQISIPNTRNGKHYADTHAPRHYSLNTARYVTKSLCSHFVHIVSFFSAAFYFFSSLKW